MMQIKNWTEYQHYKGRRPPWVKLYRDLLDSEEFHVLSPQAAKVLVLLWLLASEDETMQGLLPSKKKISFRLRITEKLLESSLSELDHWVVQDASKMLAECKQLVSSETETETETETRVRDQRTERDLPAPVSPSLTVEQIVELWNQIPGVARAKSVTGPIRKRLIARISDYPDLAWWISYFDRIRASEFLTGRSKADFAATLDWVLGPKNLAKILNGNYDGRPMAPKPQTAIEKFLQRGANDQGTVLDGVDLAHVTAVGPFLPRK